MRSCYQAPLGGRFAAAGPSPALPHPCPATRPAANGQVVYILDDDPGARVNIESLVDSMGLPSRTVLSAEAFLADLPQSSGGCLVTDARVRGVSGLELLERLSSRAPRIPTIVTTGVADVSLAVRVMEAGAFTLLQKPLHDQELWEAIDRALVLETRWRTCETQRRQMDDRLQSLSDNERQVLALIMEGRTNKGIARVLELGLRTVEARRHSIMDKLDVNSLAELVRFVSECQSPGVCLTCLR
jgi:FixJ family two-component response regulator